MTGYSQKTKQVSDYVIGIDFDNTIINYDKVMYEVASEHGVVPEKIKKNKREIRDWVRKLPNGEIEWQKIQAIVYGPRILDATLVDGVKNFFELCKQKKATVYIISHKTKYSNLYKRGTDLRATALNWMEKNHFFDAISLSKEKVHFESTRDEKIEKIRSLGCTYFIDDMEEVFLSDNFPKNVKKILYAPNQDSRSYHGLPQVKDLNIFGNWNEICNYIFNERV